MADSKYGSFLESYNKGFNQYQINLTNVFFTRIQSDLGMIQSTLPADDSFLRSKMQQITEYSANSQLDAWSRLKLMGKTLQDIRTKMSTYNDTIKQHLANIMNAFFDVARETEDEDLLKIAADISSGKP